MLFYLPPMTPDFPVTDKNKQKKSVISTVDMSREADKTLHKRYELKMPLQATPQSKRKNCRKFKNFCLHSLLVTHIVE